MALGGNIIGENIYQFGEKWVRKSVVNNPSMMMFGPSMGTPEFMNILASKSIGQIFYGEGSSGANTQTVWTVVPVPDTGAVEIPSAIDANVSDIVDLVFTTPADFSGPSEEPLAGTNIVKMILPIAFIGVIWYITR